MLLFTNTNLLSYLFFLLVDYIDVVSCNCKITATSFFGAVGLMQMSFVIELYIILYVYVYTCIQIHLYRLDIGSCKFVNKFIRFQYTIYNSLTIYIFHFVVKTIYNF